MAQLSTRLDHDQMITKWASVLNPIIANPLNNVSILKEITLQNGLNYLNHKLGRIQQGWFLVDVQSPAVIYRPTIYKFNDLTLTLSSNADVIVSIGVF